MKYDKRIRFVNGEYFVYTDTRVLGPYTWYSQAFRAAVEYDTYEKHEAGK